MTELDLAILYSNPLIDVNGDKKTPYSPVGFYQEIQKIKEEFTRQNIGIKYKISYASLKNLIEVLNM
jgi:hypothetical protein